MNPSVMGAEDGESDRNTSLPTGPGPDRGRGRQARRMKIDSIYPLPLRGGRVRVGVNIQILSPLTSILSHRGERRYLIGLFSEQLYIRVTL
jgi:hypothetical protein